MTIRKITVAISTAAAAAVCDSVREVRYVAAAVVGSSRRKPKTREQVVACTLMQHV